MKIRRFILTQGRWMLKRHIRWVVTMDIRMLQRNLIRSSLWFDENNLVMVGGGADRLMDCCFISLKMHPTNGRRWIVRRREPWSCGYERRLKSKFVGSNPSTVYWMDILSHQFIVMLVCRKDENKQKEAGDGPFKKRWIVRFTATL